MEEIADPSFSQPNCSDCGLPIRSASFDLVSDMHRYDKPTSGGIVAATAHGLPKPIKRQVNEWAHDDPRAVNDHRPIPAAYGARHTHDSDYERQERSWRMSEMEKRAYLGQQFQ
jgi:hypothetical protein